VIATGVQYSVRQFVEQAARVLGFDLLWQGRGVDECAIDRVSGRAIVRIDPRYFRPAEVDTLLGDASKARAELGWKPVSSFEELVTEMVAADMVHAEREVHLRRAGFEVAPRHE
jgi:GDPmannose 4,6-dehydratase